MTNKDAIKLIKAIKEKYIHGGDEGFDECRNQALDLAIKALENSSWIPIKTKKLSPEEIREFCEERNKFSPEEMEGAWSYDCKLPDDIQEVLITTNYGIAFTTFFNDYEYGAYFESYEDENDVLAWMPLPKPYTKEEQS